MRGINADESAVARAVESVYVDSPTWGCFSTTTHQTSLTKNCIKEIAIRTKETNYKRAFQ